MSNTSTKKVNSMFSSIKDALAKGNEKVGPSNILRFEPGNMYVVRLLPYTPEPEKTFFKYYVHSWKSFATGQRVSQVSPTTYGERDPISEERFRYLRLGTEDEKARAETVKRQEKYLCNVYVVDDSKTPENKGTVKFIRYGKQLEKIISTAMNEEADEFGPRIFDLSKDGVNLKIKVEMQGEFPTFTSSRFTSPVDLHLTQEKQDEIYESVKDPMKVNTVLSYDELKSFFAMHFTPGATNTQANTTTKATESVKSENKKAQTAAKVEADVTEELSAEDVEDLLKDIN